MEQLLGKEGSKKRYVYCGEKISLSSLFGFFVSWGFFGQFKNLCEDRLG